MSSTANTIAQDVELEYKLAKHCLVEASTVIAAAHSGNVADTRNSVRTLSDKIRSIQESTEAAMNRSFEWSTVCSGGSWGRTPLFHDTYEVPICASSHACPAA